MTKKTTTTLTVATAYCVLMSGVLGYAYIAVTAQRGEAAALRQTLAEQLAKEEAAVMIETAMKNTEAERVELSRYFLAEKDTISFIASIEDLAQRVGVTIETTGLDLVKPAEGRSELKTSFQIAGNKAAVLRFVQAIETLPYHSRMPTWQLSSGDGKVWEAEITVMVTMTL